MCLRNIKLSVSANVSSPSHLINSAVWFHFSRSVESLQSFQEKPSIKQTLTLRKMRNRGHQQKKPSQVLVLSQNYSE